MKWGMLGGMLAGLIFAALPSSTNYSLHNYGFGSGGTSNSTSTNYGLNATTGQTSNTQSTSTTYKARPGDQNSQQSNVPPAPTFTNPSNYYDKLKVVINTGNNPTDTKFSLAISTDNFVTTQYVHPDGTISTTFTAATDLQTYTAWGGATGQLITGLTPRTTYQIKANAMQGKFTETEYGPTASASTVAANISFSLFTSTQSVPPFTTSFASLIPGTVVNSNDQISFNLATNANSGAIVYISSTNAGLTSASKSFTIPSATADLASAASGYGAQGQSATQTSGGPLGILSPYNGAGSNVGIINTSIKPMFSTSAPITGGVGSFYLKARASSTTPSSSDYSDKITLISAGIF